MTRKESEKDSERPHYYSQFWLDVAAGRRIIGAPKPEDNEPAEVETPEPTPARRASRANDHEHVSDRRAAADGLAERVVHPVAEPIAAQRDFAEPEAALDLTDEDTEDEVPDLPVEDTDIPDMDLGPVDEDEYFEEEEEEEEEDEDEVSWGRGRKKPKPGRTVKQPAKKPGKRDPRRGY